MKIFYSLNQRLEAWRRSNQNRRHPLFSNETSSLGKSSPRDKPSSEQTPHFLHNSPWQTPFMLLVSVASLTSVVGYRFYNQPQLAVGTISPETIIAPRSGQAVDEETTEQKRKDARTGIGVIPVLKRDSNITEQTLRELENFLEQVEQLRALTGTFPFVQEQLLSLVTQRYLRRAPESEWKTILAALNPQFPPTAEPSIPTANPLPQRAIDSAMEQAVGELYNYRQKLGEESFRKLLQKLVNIRQGYTEAQKYIVQQPTVSLRTEYIITMLELRDEVWVEMKKGLAQATQRILTQGISPGLPENLLKDSVKTQLYFTVPAKTEPVANALLLKILRPNLIEDPEKTQQKALRQAEEMQPVMVEIKQGEVIVHAGEEITQEDFVLLDYLGLSRRRISWEELVLCGAFVTTSVGVFWVTKRQLRVKLRRRDLILLWLFSLSAPLLEVFKIPYTSLPAIGFLAGSFYGSGLAVTLITILTGFVTFSSGILTWEFLLAGSAGGILAALISGRLRSREELSLLGVCVALTQGAVFLFVQIFLGISPAITLYSALPHAVFYSLSGLMWSIIALGISPYLERLFDVITPIRLAELSNPNRPLLKRLAIEAPGTFQHTLFVASLAEAAARELHGNVELIRAGTLYHDIGKMHDPLGFIENQMGGPNKHDEINDPWVSAAIIKKHVTEGLVMARKCGLPKAIRDFIPQHQGTMTISYFYFQAKQKQKEDRNISVEESDFCYDGPIPQSKEAGIVMLADGCEAALRSLKDTTPEAALNLMNKIFRARWREGQLAESGITQEELKVIAEVFVQVWQQSNHRRIAYPKAALEPSKVQPQA